MTVLWFSNVCRDQLWHAVLRWNDEMLLEVKELPPYLPRRNKRRGAEMCHGWFVWPFVRWQPLPPQKALCTSFGFSKIGRRVHHLLSQHSACHFSAGVNWSHIGVTFTVMANWLATEELFANALKWFFPHYIFCAMQLYHPRVAICLDNKPQGSLRQLYQWSVKSDYTGVESLKTHWSLYLVQCTMPPLVLFIDFPGSDDQLEWFCVNKIERPRQDMELSKFLARIK